MLWSRLAVIVAMQLVLSYFLGRVMIPIFRKLKTGVYEPYIGDRYKSDGSEPSFGGVCQWIVFAFGIAVAAIFTSNRAQLFASLIYSLAIVFVGALDDYMTDAQGKPYGVKAGAKLGFCYVASFIYIYVCVTSSWIDTAIMLPFHLGIVDFGYLFCPITAAAMTLIIYSFRALNRFGIDDKSSIGGLVYAVGFIVGLGAAVIGNLSDNDTLTAYGYVSAAVSMGAMIWGLSPSKLKSGSSGGFLIGALSASVLAFDSFYALAALLLSISAFVDAFCSAMQNLVYRRKKKLLLKGSSLHMHLKVKGMSDYTVIVIFSIISILGIAAAVGIVYYGQKVYF
ncbi:MAG: hypothetical protein LUI06_02480 [Ruminococcus sp.]|nr:hypothetical protein [Ruminococcus sp.]